MKKYKLIINILLVAIFVSSIVFLFLRNRSAATPAEVIAETRLKTSITVNIAACRHMLWELWVDNFCQVCLP